jgi:hypothetical protein
VSGLAEKSPIPVFVPPGDEEFAQAVRRAFPSHEVVTDANLSNDQIRIGGGPVLELDQHHIRRPTKANEYDFYNMGPFFRDLGNLQTKFLILEYDLRTFLFNRSGKPFIQDFDTISVGDFVDENPFTNRDSLGTLIDKYNVIVKNAPSAVIHRNIVKIRDALAHGRVYRRSVESQLRLLKFSQVDKATGKVETDFAETLDPPTLGRWNAYMFMTIRKVEDYAKAEAAKSLGKK